jgi:hypothetical protein
MDDPFIRNYIEDLLKNIRTQVLLKLIKPYTRIRIPFISMVSIELCINYMNDTSCYLCMCLFCSKNLQDMCHEAGSLSVVLFVRAKPLHFNFQSISYVCS